MIDAALKRALLNKEIPTGWQRFPLTLPEGCTYTMNFPDMYIKRVPFKVFKEVTLFNEDHLRDWIAAQVKGMKAIEQ